MSRPGRKDKTLIEVPGTSYGLGMTQDGYTVEKWLPSTGWQPIKWPDTLPEAAELLLEYTVRARLIGALGGGVSKITQELVDKLLEEVSDVESRVYREAVEFCRGADALGDEA